MVRPLLDGGGMRSVLAFVLVPGLAACTTYAQHRAALVPHSTPLPYDGRGLDTQGALQLGASNIADLGKPGVGDPDAGDAVPGVQARGELDVQLRGGTILGVVHEHGFAGTATAIKPSEPKLDDHDVGGYGFTIKHAFGDGPWRFGLAGELLVWAVPWVQYTTCVDTCPDPGYTTMDRGTSNVPALALAVVESYHQGPWTVFFGATGRNHPTITEKIETVDPDPADVQAGPFNLILDAGVEVDLGGGLRASLLVHQTVTRDPIVYAPGIGAMLTLPLGASTGNDARATPGA